MLDEAKNADDAEHRRGFLTKYNFKIDSHKCGSYYLVISMLPELLLYQNSHNRYSFYSRLLLFLKALLIQTPKVPS